PAAVANFHEFLNRDENATDHVFQSFSPGALLQDALDRLLSAVAYLYDIPLQTARGLRARRTANAGDHNPTSFFGRSGWRSEGKPRAECNGDPKGSCATTDGAGRPLPHRSNSITGREQSVQRISLPTKMGQARSPTSISTQPPMPGAHESTAAIGAIPPMPAVCRRAAVSRIPKKNWTSAPWCVTYFHVGNWLLFVNRFAAVPVIRP